tara:strand:- start:377 stop:649 length:273 start_codon:yes stop_codon:yes gene_type:complete
MNNEKNYDWDKEFQKLNLICTERPTIETHWQKKDGICVKYTDMSNKHLINTLRFVCFRTTKEDNIYILEMYKIISSKIIKELQNREVLEI